MTPEGLQATFTIAGSRPSKLNVSNGPRRTSGVQRKESFTTGSFAVAQFDSSQKPLVAFGNMSDPVLGETKKQPFAMGAGQPTAVDWRRSATEKMTQILPAQRVVKPDPYYFDKKLLVD